jgi:putative peptidoglycan lipid II flippase
MSKQNSFLRKIYAVSLSIIVCRGLGLLREILLAKTFGGSALMSAWGLAFMFPNLFRRLFGEGAVGVSIVPIISYSIKEDGKEEARKKFGAIFLILAVVLFSLSCLFSLIALLCEPFASAERVRLALELMPLLMPYAFFICLIGAMTSTLNSLGRFFLPSIGMISLNLVMIFFLLLICPHFTEKTSMLKALSIGVVLSGIIQFLFTIILLKTAGFFPVLRISQFWNAPAVKELWRLSLPGIIGASAVQISFVADRAMACWLGDYAVPALNYSDRIVDLPIGIFAVAMSIVLMPKMAKSAAENNHEEHLEQFFSSLKFMIFASIPAAVFIFLFRIPAVQLFYMRGAFGERELYETVHALKFYSLGIPFFCCIKIITSAFYSKKDMKTPVKVSILCIVLNIILNFLLMFKLKQGGIALATVISSFVNCAFLMFILKKRTPAFKPAILFPELFKISVSAVISGGLVYSLFSFFSGYFSIISRFLPQNLLSLSAAGLLFVSLFFLLSLALGAEGPVQIIRSIRMKVSVQRR